MGAVVWQLNDIWPVASWASIDYYGRWKALHYAEKRMFAPVMISCEETGELSERPFCVSEPHPIPVKARLHVANETMQEIKGTVKWKVCLPDSSVLLEGGQELTVPALEDVYKRQLHHCLQHGKYRSGWGTHRRQYRSGTLPDSF